MIDRQPSRPTEDEFIGAASRFVKDDYESVPTHSPFNLGVVQFIRPGKDLDMKIIRDEHQWEGRRGEPETLEEFAIRQLTWYQTHRLDDL